MSADGLVNVPVDTGALARVLDRHPDFRVLRRLGPFERSEKAGLRTRVLRGVVLDTETTGMDSRSDRIVELAMCPFGADEHGRIVEAGPMAAWLEDPGAPLSAEIRRVTGLTDADLVGRSIRDGEAVGMLRSADVVIAHHARFDRPFVEARLPEAVGSAWACSLTEVDWKGMGFEGRTQSQLVSAIGGFYDAHRASSDVNALLHLLDHVLPDGRSVLSLLVERARRPTFLLQAFRTPRDAGPALRTRGWRWSSDVRAWTIEVDEARLDEEVDWATIRIYSAADAPSVSKVDWTTRHAG